MDEDKTIEKYDETMDIIDEEEEESPIIMEVENSDSNIEENLIEYIVEKLDDDKNDSSLEEATSANNSLSETNVKELKEVVTPGTSTSLNQIKVGAKTPAGGGQIVILQGSGGQHQQVRIAQNHAPQGHGFKFLKTTDGNIIQIRNKSSPNSVPLNTMKKIVPQPMIKNTIGKLIYKGISVSGNEQQILLATPPTKTTASNSSGTIMTPIPTPKTISLSQAQQLGLLAGKMKQIVTIGQKPKTLQLIKPAPKILPATSTGTTNSNVYTNVVKKFGLPQLQPKIAIQQINKTDVKKVQYVRFVSIGGSTATTPTTSTVTAGKLSTQGKVMASLPAGQQKILIQGKSGQTVAVIQKPPNSSGQTKIMTMTPMQSKQVATNKGVLQTYATQKKIFSLGKQPNENLPKLIAVVKKEDGQKSNMEMGGQKITTLTQLQLSQLQGTSVIPGNHKNPPIVMLPSNFIQQLQLKNNNNLKRKEEEMSPPPAKIKKESDLSDEDIKLSPSSDGIRRKPCNCTKSLCLKLYCDCFANGEFCQNCNCKKCYNNLENEEERQKAIRICLERNPNAFRPKIGKAKDHNESFRRHNKGCNCKRSGCLKNYCECYEAKISCSGNCKCIDCRNTDDYVEREGNNEESDTPRSSKRSLEVDNANPKQPYNFMTPDVIDATIQCMIAQADECQRTGIPTKNAEKMILEEFGRCLVEIIDFSIRNTDND